MLSLAGGHGRLTPRDVVVRQPLQQLFDRDAEQGRSGTGVALGTGHRGLHQSVLDQALSLSDGTLTEILSGLSEGDQVISLPDNGAARQPTGGFFGG